MSDREVLRNLVKLAESFRRTPIVDDDFELVRDRFDRALDDASIYLASPRPTVVCLCGSTRFFDAFRAENFRLTLAGLIVLSIGCDTKEDKDIFLGNWNDAKVALDILHLRKIDLADEVLILNVGGYIGESTARELAYARERSKVIRFLENEQ